MLQLDDFIIAKNAEVRAAQAAVDRAKEKLAQDRKIYENHVQELSDLVGELEDIKSGNYQMRLGFGDEADAEVESGDGEPATVPINCRWFNPSNGEERAVDDSPPADELSEWVMIGYHGEEYATESGEIVGGFKKAAEIPLPKSEGHGCSIDVRPTKRADDSWVSLVRFGIPEVGEEESYPRVDSESYKTQKEAVLSAVVYAYFCISGQSDPEKDFREDLGDWLVDHAGGMSLTELSQKYIEAPSSEG